MMIFFVKNFIIFSLLLELASTSPNFYYSNILFNNNIFVLYSFFLFFNFYLNDIKIKKMDFDLIYKYFLLFFKIPSYFINYSIITFKKIFSFLIFFKYKHTIKSFQLFYRFYLSNYFVCWRPLFKKTSYFGYYRSNRSKWIK